jgi:hypothetical protein
MIWGIFKPRLLNRAERQNQPSAQRCAGNARYSDVRGGGHQSCAVRYAPQISRTRFDRLLYGTGPRRFNGRFKRRLDFLFDDGVGFDFDLGFRVDESGDFDDGCGGADFGEDFAVDFGDLFPFGDVNDVHAGAEYVLDFAAEGFDGGTDDAEGSAGLFGKVA